MLLADLTEGWPAIAPALAADLADARCADNIRYAVANGSRANVRAVAPSPGAPGAPLTGSALLGKLLGPRERHIWCLFYARDYLELAALYPLPHFCRAEGRNEAAGRAEGGEAQHNSSLLASVTQYNDRVQALMRARARHGDEMLRAVYSRSVFEGYLASR